MNPRHCIPNDPPRLHGSTLIKSRTSQSYSMEWEQHSLRDEEVHSSTLQSGCREDPLGETISKDPTQCGGDAYLLKTWAVRIPALFQYFKLPCFQGTRGISGVRLIHGTRLHKVQSNVVNHRASICLSYQPVPAGRPLHLLYNSRSTQNFILTTLT